MDLTTTYFALFAQAQQGQGGIVDTLLWLIPPALLLIGFFLLMRPEQKKRKEMEDLISNLKKNDRVETIGGIVATVVSVKKDQGEVVVRIDEKTNAEMRLKMRAIARVLDKENNGKSDQRNEEKASAES
ncbi:preprotein translocase subunit YajC [Blastopirellula sp. JC732]|uniref:Sec translocon accessory complex subunit YajC n=1 Tax=Blastopirellula sediminis TaxID=2894196 RepID=A0A9X1MT24_9BACT|nr:preprotein translocase subunit YajC [Blastopirellula sediminis]MCC9604806.1 preprotein translocase subunit YajC [Blastopirellula sediminis]MCC9631895.1 preprotein translocase subunit YajC [Blastopirellula sediminis]